VASMPRAVLAIHAEFDSSWSGAPGGSPTLPCGQGSQASSLRSSARDRPLACRDLAVRLPETLSSQEKTA
jgi:hypothetical protein